MPSSSGVPDTVAPVASMAPTAPKAKCILEPINLHDQAQADELLRQRKVCGWAMTPDYIDTWRDAMDAQSKFLFWITPTAQPDLRAGHIGLDSQSEPPDLQLANPHDKSILTISRFFVLPAHRGGGLGRAAMETLEGYARQAPFGSDNCRVIAITTTTRRYCEENDWRTQYEYLTGMPARPKGSSYEDWYARMGYVKFKEAPLYDLGRPGFEAHRLVASYMRKTIA